MADLAAPQGQAAPKFAKQVDLQPVADIQGRGDPDAGCAGQMPVRGEELAVSGNGLRGSAVFVHT